MEKFTGAGQALGGSTPTPAVEDAPLPEAPVVDAAKPVAKFRLRLASGKEPWRSSSNEEHTVGHLRAFVAAQGAGEKPPRPRNGLPAEAPTGQRAQWSAPAGLAGERRLPKLRAWWSSFLLPL